MRLGMRDVRNSRKGLSPLLAIIIGLIVTIVAGILLAQLYFSYAATISARPAANVEYVDLVTDGTNSYLVINIKNTGNVPIDSSTDITVSDGTYTPTCGLTADVPPGATTSCVIDDGAMPSLPTTPGATWSGFVIVPFTDGSTQTYAISVRARSA